MDAHVVDDYIYICLSRKKTKGHFSKNTTLTPTKILPKKQDELVFYSIMCSIVFFCRTIVFFVVLELPDYSNIYRKSHPSRSTTPIRKSHPYIEIAGWIIHVDYPNVPNGFQLKSYIVVNKAQYVRSGTHLIYLFSFL